MSSSKDTDWEDVLAETPWDSDIREQLQEARMIGKEAILLANVMKQPMEQLMQLCCERFDVVVRLAVMLRKERQEVRKLRDEKTALESMPTSTAADESWSRSNATASVAPFPITGLLLEKSGPFDSFADALTSKTFYEWCCSSLNNENLEFYFSVELYRTLPPQARAVKAAEMLRHFVREGASAQINIDHSVRSDLEAALPPSLLELVEKMTADAKAKAAAGGPAATPTTAAAAAEDDGAVAASGKKGKVKTKKTTSATDDSSAPLNIAADIFDVAQSRVYELMERDLWARFRVDQAGSAASPRGKLKTKKPLAASTPSTPTPNANTTTTTTTTTTATPSSSTPTATPNSSSNNVKQVSPRRKTNAATTPNTVSSVSAILQAPAMVTQIKRVNGKIVVYRKGE